MKHTIINRALLINPLRICFIGWLLTASFCFPIPGFTQETIRLGVSEFVPYISKGLPGYGFLPQIISESFALSGIRVEYMFVPWKRALIMAERGELDGSPAWFRTPEREKAFHISSSLIDDSQSFFYLKSFSFDWKTIKDLEGITIGATLGYDYGKEFCNAEKKGGINVQWVTTDSQNFKKLFAQRIMVFPMNTFAGYAILKKEFSHDAIKQVTHHPLPIRSEPLHLLLSRRKPGNAQRIQLFNQGLEVIKKNGKYDMYFKNSPLSPSD